MHEREVKDRYLDSLQDPKIRDAITLLRKEPLQAMMAAAMDLQA
jgi:hypothetical protein